MDPIELRLPDGEMLQEWSREAEHELKPDIVTDGSGEIDLAMSVDVYLLGGNRRVSTERANRMRAHLENPVLLAGFKDASFDRYQDMMNEYRRENGRRLRQLHEGFQESLGDHQVFLEELYDLISDGHMDSIFFRTPVELEGIEECLEAAETADRMMRKNPDYEVKEVRLLGGVEEETVEDAMDVITPAVSLEITYSGDQEAFEKYVEYAEQYIGPPSDTDGIPGTVYLGRENRPQVVFNGPPYETLRSEEIEKDIWRKIEK